MLRTAWSKFGENQNITFPNLKWTSCIKLLLMIFPTLLIQFSSKITAKCNNLDIDKLQLDKNFTTHKVLFECKTGKEFIYTFKKSR